MGGSSTSGLNEFVDAVSRSLLNDRGEDNKMEKLRRSTLLKTADVEGKHSKQSPGLEHLKRKRRHRVYTQAQLLEESKETEIRNKESLSKLDTN